MLKHRLFYPAVVSLSALALCLVACGKSKPSAKATPTALEAKTPLRAVWLLPQSASSEDLKGTLTSIEDRGFRSVMYQLKSDSGLVVGLKEFSEVASTSNLNIIYNYPVKWGTREHPSLSLAAAPLLSATEQEYYKQVPNSFDPAFWPSETEQLKSVRDTLLSKEPTSSSGPTQLVLSHLAFTDRTTGLNDQGFQRFVTEAKRSNNLSPRDVLRYDTLGQVWVEGPQYNAWLDWRRSVVFREGQELLSLFQDSSLGVGFQGEGIEPLATEKGFSVSQPNGLPTHALKPASIFLECFTPYVTRENAVAEGIPSEASVQGILLRGRSQLSADQSLYAVLSVLVFAGEDGLLNEEEKGQLYQAMQTSEALANGWVLVDWDVVQVTTLQLPRS